MRTFNGTNQYFQRNEGAGTPIGDDFTFMARLKPSAVPDDAGDAAQTILAFVQSDTNVRGLFVSISHDGTRQRVRFNWTSGYATNQDRYKYKADNSAFLANGVTSVLCAKGNCTSGTIKAWVNNVELDSGSGSGAGYSGTFTAGGEQYSIGRWVAGSLYFNGSLGQVGLWFGEQLTDAQCQAISRGADPRLYGTRDRFVPMKWANQAASSNETDSITSGALTASNSPGVEVDQYGLIYPPVTGRLQALSARLGGGL